MPGSHEYNASAPGADERRRPAFRFGAEAGRAALRCRPVADSLVADKAVADSPVADSAAVDKAVADSPVANSPAADKAVADSPVADSAAPGQGRATRNSVEWKFGDN